jgi:transcriptional regulator with XRE-family HTH domain
VRNNRQDLILKKIGLTLYKQRQFKRLSRTQVAIHLSTDEKQIRRIESGEVNFTILTLLKLCYVLEINPSFLLDLKLSENILND